MKKSIRKLIIGIVVSIVSSLLLLLTIVKKEHGEFSWKKLFSFETLQQLNKLYMIIIDGFPNKDDHLIANIFGGLQAVNKLYQLSFLKKEQDWFLNFIKTHNLELVNNAFIMPLALNTHIKNLISISRKYYELNEDISVTTITFPDGDKIYVEDGPGESSESRNSAKSKQNDSIISELDSYRIAVSKEFNLQSKIDLFWSHYKNGVYVSSINSYERSSLREENGNISFQELPVFNFKFFGKISKEIPKFVDKLRIFRNEKIQRSYLFIGKAGTGKTSTIFEIIRQFGNNNKLMKISSELFSSFEQEDLDFVFNCLRPDFVVLDDFDRVYDDSSDADILYFFETLKVQHPDITVFATVNSMRTLGEALIRPGRFDEIVVFSLPKEEERESILKCYLDEFGAKIPTEIQLRKLVDITDGFSPAYIKEFCLQLKFNSSIPDLIKRILVTKQFIGSEDFSDGEEEFEEQE